MIKKQIAERQEAIEKLREWLKPGDTVYTIIRHVSKSGMTRHIGVVILKDGIDLHPNYAVADATKSSINKRGDAVVVGGCGMDMGFHLVYTLSYALFKDGFGCIGEHCPSNDHSNGDRDYTPHKPYGLKPLSEHWHKDGGYALKQRWL